MLCIPFFGELCSITTKQIEGSNRSLKSNISIYNIEKLGFLKNQSVRPNDFTDIVRIYIKDCKPIEISSYDYDLHKEYLDLQVGLLLDEICTQDNNNVSITLVVPSEKNWMKNPLQCHRNFQAMVSAIEKNIRDNAKNTIINFKTECTFNFY